MKRYSELTDREITIEGFRCLGVLPAAWLGNLAGGSVGVLVCLGLVLAPDAKLTLITVIPSMAGGAAMVIAGAMMAPRFRRTIAIVTVYLCVSYACWIMIPEILLTLSDMDSGTTCWVGLQ